MSAIATTIVSQFGNPTGLLGRLAGHIMAHRPSNKARNLWTLELLELQPFHSVLEIGCGPGFALRACASRLTTGRVVGLDHSQVMLEQSRSRLKREANRVALESGSIERLSEWRDAFDRIYMVNVFQFLREQAAALTRIQASLRQGGIVAITYQPRHKNPTRSQALARAAQISALLTRAGFVAVETRVLELKPVPAVCVLARKP